MKTSPQEHLGSQENGNFSDGCLRCWEDTEISSSWRAQELVKVIFTEASEKTVQWFTQKRGCPGPSGPAVGLLFKQRYVREKKGEGVLAAPGELEFHSRVLRLKTSLLHFVKCTSIHISTQDFPEGAQGEAGFFLHPAFLRHSGRPHTDLDKSLTVGFVDLNREASPKLPKKMSSQEWPRSCHLGLACSLLQFACPE